MKKIFTLLALSSGLAQATQLDFGVSVPQKTSIGASEIPVFGGFANVELSTLGAAAGFGRLLTLPAIGAVDAGAQLKYAWGGKFLLLSQASASAGPVALNLKTSIFNASISNFEPAALWDIETTDTRSGGFSASVSAKYRVSRKLIAIGSIGLGALNYVKGGVEYRQPLDRALPPEDGDNSNAPPEMDNVGYLILRASGTVGTVSMLSAGASLGLTQGTELSVDSSFSSKGIGMLTSLVVPDVIGADSSVTAYIAYEPWQENAMPLRLGAEVATPFVGGTATASIKGGKTPSGDLGFGFGIKYSLPIGGQP